MSILVQQYYQLTFHAVEVCVYNKQHYLNTTVWEQTTVEKKGKIMLF